MGRATACTPRQDSTGTMTESAARPKPGRSWMASTVFGALDIGRVPSIKSVRYDSTTNERTKKGVSGRKKTFPRGFREVFCIIGRGWGTLILYPGNEGGVYDECFHDGDSGCGPGRRRGGDGAGYPGPPQDAQDRPQAGQRRRADAGRSGQGRAADALVKKAPGVCRELCCAGKVTGCARGWRVPGR